MYAASAAGVELRSFYTGFRLGNAELIHHSHGRRGSHLAINECALSDGGSGGEVNLNVVYPTETAASPIWKIGRLPSERPSDRDRPLGHRTLNELPVRPGLSVRGPTARLRPSIHAYPSVTSSSIAVEQKRKARINFE